MKSSFAFRFAFILCLSMSFVVSVFGQQSGKNQTKSTSTSQTTRSLVSTAPGQVEAAPGLPNTRKGALLRRILKAQQSEQTGKKISGQLEQIQKIEEGKAKFLEEENLRQMLESQMRDRVTVLGQPTGFSRAPFVRLTSSMMKKGRNMMPALATPLLINGKQQDTIQAGSSYDFSFSFSPGYASAILNIYLDVDSNGVVGPEDLPILQDALLMDNGQSDLDQADGSFRYTVRSGDNLSNLIGKLIFQVNDYQSVNTATLNILTPTAASVIKGSTDPAIPGIIVSLSTSVGNIYAGTDSNGKFTASVPQAPPYTVSVSLYDPAGTTSGFLLPQPSYYQLYKDTSTITIKPVSSTSFVEGYVNDYDGNPVPNATVIAYTNHYYSPTDPTVVIYGTWTVQTKTDASGHYRLGLIGGAWYIYSRVDWTDQYFSVSSQSVIAPSSGTIHVNLTLAKANAAISGKVTLNSKGIGGIALYASSNYLGSSTVLSNGDGSYSIPTFNLGVYSASVSLSDAGYIADTPYKYSLPPDTSGVNFSIRKVAGGAAGKITDSKTHAPVSGATISFSGAYYLTTMADDSGNYRMPLPDGSYSVYISARGYNSYSTYNLNIAGQVVASNYALSPTTSITGKVTNADGVPLISATVVVQDTNQWSSYYGYTDNQGVYFANVSAPGKYKVEAQATGYVLQWYNGKSTFASADVVNATDGSQTTGINFSLSRGGMISGKVRNVAGQPVSNAEIVIYDSTYYWQCYVYTDDSGEYTAAGLKSGKYFAYATASGYINLWYDGKTSFQTATPIPVVLNQETGGINFTLSKGATISGKVTDKNSMPIYSAYVSLYDTSMYFVTSTYTQNDGTFSLSRIPPGSYYASASASSYGRIWYDNKTNQEEATLLNFQGEENKSGINFTLPHASSMSGTVADGGGNPVQSASVYSIDFDSTQIYSAYTMGDGSYSISGLSPGKFFAWCYSNNYNFTPSVQWYNQKTSSKLADTILVSADSATQHIDFTFTRPGSISGVVRDDQNQTTVPYMLVEAINSTTNSVLTTSSDYSGNYQISVSPGEYRLRVVPPNNGNYLMTYYSHDGTAILPSQADAITLNQNDSKSGLDIHLRRVSYPHVLAKGRLSMTPGNNGKFGPMDTISVSCRWPDQTSKNYLSDASLIVGASSGGNLNVFGTLNSSWYPSSWIPLWNYSEQSTNSEQFAETFFTGSLDTFLFIPQLSVDQRYYSFANTDYVIITNTIHYDGTLFGQEMTLSDVYVGEVLHLNVSNGKDLAGKIDSDKLVYVCDSTKQGGVNVGISSVGRSAVNLGWWKRIHDPNTDFAGVYNALKTSASSSQSDTASDYRVFVSSGPYTIHKGDSIVFSFAIVAGEGLDSLISVSSSAAAKYKGIIDAIKVPGKNPGSTPSSFAVYQNYPNPFNPSTKIAFDLKETSKVGIRVYNVLGQTIERIELGTMGAGKYEQTVDMEKCPSGIYFYSVTAISSSGERSMAVKKMLLLK